jgi:TolB-like protein
MKAKPLLFTILVLVLIVVGYFLIPKLSKSSKTVEKSIAVLPFVNDSPNDSTAYFTNGIMEEILSDLSKVEDMKVLSRTSVEPYRNTTKSIAEIAKELRIKYVLEGSTEKIGNIIIVRVQLIDAKSNHRLWGGSFQKEILDGSELFTVQKQIAQDIATRIKMEIAP